MVLLLLIVQLEISRVLPVPVLLFLYLCAGRDGTETSVALLFVFCQTENLQLNQGRLHVQLCRYCCITHANKRVLTRLSSCVG